jgi:hypothetical protein
MLLLALSTAATAWGKAHTLLPDVSAAKETAHKPRVLILASDHGTGSSSFSSALDFHPCMVNLNEIFAGVGPSGMQWAKAAVDDTSPALFHANFSATRLESNRLLERRLQELGIPPQIHDLYKHLKFNPSEFFARLRTHVCAHAAESKVWERFRMCQDKSQCTIAAKWFPAMVGAITDTLNSPKEFHEMAGRERQEHAMAVWAKTLRQFAEDPRVGLVHIERDEDARELSNFRRFPEIFSRNWNAPNSFFNCSYNRPRTAFSKKANKLVPHNFKIEDCWASQSNAASCVEQALTAVGLDMTAMTPEGASTELMHPCQCTKGH